MQEKYVFSMIQIQTSIFGGDYEIQKILGAVSSEANTEFKYFTLFNKAN
jgi:hypothetical protein